jgi:hypothetical protein
MAQDQAIGLTINPEIQQVVGKSSIDRVVLVDVKKAWTDCQSTRDRSAMYAYLHMVFMQVDWWERKPDEMREAPQTIEKDKPNVKLPDDMYAAVIMLTEGGSQDPQQMVAGLAKLLDALTYAIRLAAVLSALFHDQAFHTFGPTRRLAARGEQALLRVGSRPIAETREISRAVLVGSVELHPSDTRPRQANCAGSRVGDERWAPARGVAKLSLIERLQKASVEAIADRAI